MNYDPQTMARVEGKLDNLTQGGGKMGPAEIMALIQSNKGMDLPGILALCQKNGADTSGNNMWWIILLFLFIGGGNFGGMGNRSVAEAALGGAENLQMVTSLYDRINVNQTTTSQGFANLSTQLCEAISTTMGAVRDQGDRMYDATRNVGDTVRDCCCKMESNFARLTGQIDNIGAKIDLAQERTANALAQMEGRLALQNEREQGKLALQMERNQNETNAQFCALNNKLDKDRLGDQVEFLKGQIALKDARLIANETAAAQTAQLQRFITNHYTPTA